ncbi:hypothetical protein FQA39_LY01104 [Lamprigera yunnana]|nr:hypothetical protein FQA39_LY01104 [Lamprigera yunnana]
MNDKLQHMSHKNGLRKSIFTANHDVFVGEWKNSLKEGHGSYLSRSYKLYEGEWYNDFRHGFGVSCWRDNDKVFHLEYRGAWKKGFQHGFGMKQYPDESVYIGYLKYSNRHGMGQMWYVDGSYYDGEWKNDLRHGLGMLVNFDGNRYEGSWKCGMKHGKGRYFHLDSGQMQEGVWHKDICIYSIIVDIPFRQTAVSPTSYPIQNIEVIDANQVCKIQEDAALSGYLTSYENLPEDAKAGVPRVPRHCTLNEM